MKERKALSILLDEIIKRSDQLTALLLAFGIVWLVTLPLHERVVKTDEKALMIGGATSTLR